MAEGPSYTTLIYKSNFLQLAKKKFLLELNDQRIPYDPSGTRRVDHWVTEYN